MKEVVCEKAVNNFETNNKLFVKLSYRQSVHTSRCSILSALVLVVVVDRGNTVELLLEDSGSSLNLGDQLGSISEGLPEEALSILHLSAVGIPEVCGSLGTERAG